MKTEDGCLQARMRLRLHQSFTVMPNLLYDNDQGRFRNYTVRDLARKTRLVNHGVKWEKH